jgi:hypothetical protein
VVRYSERWPGYPEPNVDDAMKRMRGKIEAFTIANSAEAKANPARYDESATDKLLKETASAATVWRASFSASYVTFSHSVDFKSLLPHSPAPEIVARGKVGNFSDETAGDVKVLLKVADEKACRSPRASRPRPTTPRRPAILRSACGDSRSSNPGIAKPR